MYRYSISEDNSFRMVFVKYIYQDKYSRAINGRELEKVEFSDGSVFELKSSTFPGVIFQSSTDVSGDVTVIKSDISVKASAKLPIKLYVKKYDETSLIVSEDSAPNYEYLYCEKEGLEKDPSTLKEYLEVLIHKESRKLLFSEGNPVMIFGHDEKSNKVYPNHVQTHETIMKIVYSIMSEVQREDLGKSDHISFVFKVKSIGRFRAEIYLQKGVHSLVIFPLGQNFDLKIDDHCSNAVQQLSSGSLVVVSGVNETMRKSLSQAVIQELSTKGIKHLISYENTIHDTVSKETLIVDQREYKTDFVFVGGASGISSDIVYISHELEIEQLLDFARNGSVVIYEMPGVSAEDGVLNLLQKSESQLGRTGRSVLLSLLSASVNINKEGKVTCKVIDKQLRTSIKDSDGLCLIK